MLMMMTAVAVISSFTLCTARYNYVNILEIDCVRA